MPLRQVLTDPKPTELQPSTSPEVSCAMDRGICKHNRWGEDIKTKNFTLNRNKYNSQMQEPASQNNLENSQIPSPNPPILNTIPPKLHSFEK